MKNISSLTIFQTPGPTPRGQNGGAPGVVVASLTSSQPRITRVSNGIKVDGVLGVGRASLSVEMVKPSDCLADFVCELLSVDDTGMQSLSVTRVQQRWRQGQEEGQNSQTSVSLQLLDLMHRVDTKLLVATLSTGNLESKIETLENNLSAKLAQAGKAMEQLETKVELLENRLEDKTASAERALQINLADNLNTQLALMDKKTTQLETKMDALKERLEDKIDFSERALHGQLASLQTRLEDKMKDDLGKKIDGIHAEVKQFTKQAESYSANVRETFNESLTGLSKYLKSEQTEVLKDVKSASQQLLDYQSNATDTLLSAARNVTLTQNGMQDELMKKLALAAAKISESGANNSYAITIGLGLLGRDLQHSFQQLTSDVNRSAIETLSSAQNLFVNSNSTALLAMRDLLTLKRCNRGVTNILSQASYPYPVIQPSTESLVHVPYLCDTATDGGGWIIIQRRTNGAVDFYRDWEEYKNGFGDLTGDFWLGNEHIHEITSSGPYELRVELIYQGKSAYARYGRFSLADETNSYTLNIADYSGTAGDSLAKNHNGKRFTTVDRDNDEHQENCANICAGAWWYESCAYSSLNGKWQAMEWKGPFWYTFSNKNPVSYSEMKIRHLANP